MNIKLYLHSSYSQRLFDLFLLLNDLSTLSCSWYKDSFQTLLRCLISFSVKLLVKIEPQKIEPRTRSFLDLDIEQLSNGNFIDCKSTFTVFNSSDYDSYDFHSTHCNSNSSIACQISLGFMQQLIYRCYEDFKLVSILLLFEENQELVAPLDSRWGASSIYNYKKPIFCFEHHSNWKYKCNFQLKYFKMNPTTIFMIIFAMTLACMTGADAARIHRRAIKTNKKVVLQQKLAKLLMQRKKNAYKLFF